jgi:hypothetical protein
VAGYHDTGILVHLLSYIEIFLHPLPPRIKIMAVGMAVPVYVYVCMYVCMYVCNICM